MAIETALPHLPMTLGYFRLILRAYGGDAAGRAAVLAGTGLSEADLANPAAEISLFQQVRQIENVNALIGEGWALSRPEVWNPTAHGALGVAVLSAPTLADGIDILGRYSRSRAPFLRMHPRRDGARLVMRYELTAALEESAWRPIIEISFSSFRQMCCAVTGFAGETMAFAFACAEPPDRAVLEAALGPQLSFAAPRNMASLPAAWLSQPSAFADASLFRSAVAELEEQVTRLDSPLDLRARLERLLHTMPDGRIDAPAAAAALGVSTRTLSRRLEEAGMPFRDLLDGELRRRASALLKAGLRRDEIAARLGYRDPTSLSRACRRWFAD